MFWIGFSIENPKTKFDKNFLLNILEANPIQDSLRLFFASGIRAPEVSLLSTVPVISIEEQQKELEQEQSYTIEDTTFIVQPRFRTEGKETIGSVLIKLMQNEVDE